MENDQPKREIREALGIDKLSFRLEHLSDNQQRLTREEVDGIFRLIVSEIPYSFWVIKTTLSDGLLTDTPQSQTDLALNDIVVNLGRAIYDPSQTHELASLVQAYLRSRKKLEKEYATTILNEVLKENNLLPFPEQARTALHDLAQSIVEKIITEKQSRKIPHYDPQPLISLIQPIVYNKLFNVDLARIRTSHNALFRQFAVNIAQESYEKVNDVPRLLAILKEKETALKVFQAALVEKTLPLPEFTKFHHAFSHLQSDILHRFSQLKILLDTFLKSSKSKSQEGYLALNLRQRFNEKLRRSLHNADLNLEIYKSEQIIKQLHDDLYSEIELDANTIKKLMATVHTIQVNFRKNWLRRFSQKKHLISIQMVLLDSLLGKIVLKTNINTGEISSIREGGYPKTKLVELHANAISQLTSIAPSINGMFSTRLKQEISNAIVALNLASEEVKSLLVTGIQKRTITQPDSLTTQVKPTEKSTAPITPKPSQASEGKTTVPAPKPLVISVEPEPQVKEKHEAIFTPKPLIIEEKPATPFTPKPLIIEDEPETSFTPKPLIIEDEPETSFTPKPLIIEDEPETSFTPKPLIIEDEPEAPVTPKPLIIEDEPEVSFTPKPLAIEDEPEASFTPKPLVIEDEPASAATQATEPVNEEMQAAIDTGTGIMSNYQLGEFEKPIYDAWKIMITAATGSAADTGSTTEDLFSDNQVRLYVICDLAQQTASVKEASLSPDQIQTLHSVKTTLLDALKNPLDEKSWDCFEGTERDYIDAKIAGL